MLARHVGKCACLIGLAMLYAVGAFGQNFPNKSIRLVTSGVGGGTDSAARIMAQGLTAALGQPVLVENRATGVVPGEIVSKAPPDGYTLLVLGNTFWLGPLLEKVPYDPVKDFSPITLAASVPTVLIVHPSLGANSVRDLITLAKAKPGGLNYASGGTGGASHLAAELLNSMAGVKIVRVNYASASARLVASLNGEVQVQFVLPGQAAPHVTSGKLKILAVTSAKPSVLAPGVPTMASSGLPGYEVVGLIGVFAPAKTPRPLITRLNQEIVRLLNKPETKERFLNESAEIVGTSPEQFGTEIRAEIARIGKVLKDAGIRPN